MKFARLLGLVALLASGCRFLANGIHADMEVGLKEPLSAKIQANFNSGVDDGPLVEVPVPPDDNGPCDSKVVVIDLDGVLFNHNPVGPYSAGENPVATFKEKLTAAAADPAVKAVVLRINSPGGTVPATDLMWHDLIEFRRQSGKPVIACLLDVSAGGAYYLASACDQIVAIPAALVGGIGVVLNVYYAEVAMEQMNVFDFSIKSGSRIDMGTPTRKLSDEETKLFTEMAEEYHTAFKQAVLKSRPRLKKDADFFDGRVMSARQALAAGLVDSVGHLPQAIALAGQLANVSAARTVMYCRKEHPARSLYASPSNRPIHSTLFPWSVPGLDRSRSNLFLYLWQPEPTLLKLSGI